MGRCKAAKGEDDGSVLLLLLRSESRLRLGIAQPALGCRRSPYASANPSKLGLRSAQSGFWLCARLALPFVTEAETRRQRRRCLFILTLKG